jgi:DNA modification methylase
MPSAEAAREADDADRAEPADDDGPSAAAGPAPSTVHRVYTGDARSLDAIADGSVQLVVTSPPYPMIEMWDGCFRAAAAEVGERLDDGDGPGAFEAMHAVLDRAWAECARALAPGGFLCVNVGDAVRTIDGGFRLYPNHARIIAAAVALGLAPLPDILWRKPTNAPNKFMGSGMLPAGAYVTYEHEYVLIFRKGGKRAFASAEERARRARSAFFWEERNVWFSDVWMDLRGAGQALAGVVKADRARSAAFPFELPYRLVCMYSVEGDLVLDPFAGTGTTLVAAAAAGRSSAGYEVDPALAGECGAAIGRAVGLGEVRVRERFEAHGAFVAARVASGQTLKHASHVYGFPVMTSQERDLRLLRPTGVRGPLPFAGGGGSELGSGDGGGRGGGQGARPLYAYEVDYVLARPEGWPAGSPRVVRQSAESGSSPSHAAAVEAARGGARPPGAAAVERARRPQLGGSVEGWLPGLADAGQ